MVGGGVRGSGGIVVGGAAAEQKQRFEAWREQTIKLHRMEAELRELKAMKQGIGRARPVIEIKQQQLNVMAPGLPTGHMAAAAERMREEILRAFWYRLCESGVRPELIRMYIRDAASRMPSVSPAMVDRVLAAPPMLQSRF